MGPFITETDLQFMKISLRLVNNKKNFRKIIFKVLTDITFNSFQRMSISTLSYASMGEQGCF